MSVSAEQVKELRDKTGVGLMDCKRALVEAEGDQEKALLLLRQKGQAKAEKKRTREATEGIIAHYVHADDKKGAMLELNCETDFVARNEEFQSLAREICMQIVAFEPLAIRREEIPQEVVEREKEIYAQQARNQDKPDHVVERIVEGRLDEFYERVCLLEQPYMRDGSKTVRDVIDSAIAKVGENIQVHRFVRMGVGEERGE